MHMILNLTYKMPDATDYAMEQAGLKRDTDEWEEVSEQLYNLRIGEYVHLQVDTETGSITLR